MPISTTSDLTQSLFLRRQNAALRQKLVELTKELSTGRRADLASASAGDLGPLQDLERGISRSDGFLAAIAIQKMRYDASQNALSTLRTAATDHAATLGILKDASDAGRTGSVARQGVAVFDTVISALNTTVGGASLFSGVDTGGPSVAPGKAVLDALEVQIGLAGANTADNIEGIIDEWFSPGGGYDTLGYLGGSKSTRSTAISETMSIDPLPTAEAPEIRQFLAAIAKSAIIDRGVLDALPEEKAKLASQAGLSLMAAEQSIVTLQANLGGSQKQIDAAETEVKSSRESFELARVELIGVDPFEAATRLQSTENQLESLYAVTARLAALSLTDYLA